MVFKWYVARSWVVHGVHPGLVVGMLCPGGIVSGPPKSDDVAVVLAGATGAQLENGNDPDGTRELPVEEVGGEGALPVVKGHMDVLGVPPCGSALPWDRRTPNSPSRREHVPSAANFTVFVSRSAGAGMTFFMS